jgi:protein O-GlcNAc transferase
VRLAADLDGLARLRASLRRLLKKSPLMDAPRFTRGLEDEYRAMWRRWCGRQG